MTMIETEECIGRTFPTRNGSERLSNHVMRSIVDDDDAVQVVG